MNGTLFNRWQLQHFDGNPGLRPISIATETGSVVTFPHQQFDKNPDRARRVAALVATAPELLASLKEAVRRENTTVNATLRTPAMTTWLRNAERAIEKAEGGAV